MLKSMTGFGAGLAETEDFRAAIEVKAVNQRYLDIDVHMPYVLDPFLEPMKNKVKEYASRGFERVRVRCERTAAAAFCDMMVANSGENQRTFEK